MKGFFKILKKQINGIILKKLGKILKKISKKLGKILKKISKKRENKF